MPLQKTTQPHPVRPNRWTVFLIVAVGIFMSTLDGSIVNITLPVIMRELNTSMAAVQWIVMIYLLTVTSLLLSFGRLSDIKGRRYIYTRGLILFATGSLFCTVSQTVAWLIAARLFQGVGAAMIMACTPAIVVDTFDIHERGRALGMMGAIVASGLTLGPLLGGLLMYHFSWRAIFIINIPIGIAAAIAADRCLKGGNTDISQKEPFDRAGASMLILGLGSLLLALSYGYQWGYMSGHTMALFGISGLAFSGLTWIESRIPHPIMTTSLLKIRLFTLPLLSAVVIFAGLFTLVFIMPFYLMNPAGYSERESGYIMMALFISLFFVAPVSGSLSDRIGSQLLCTLGMGILSLAFFFIAKLPPQAPGISIAWRLMLAGAGIAIFLSPNSAATMNAVPQKHRGIAASTVAAARNLGMVLGVAMAGAIFNSTFHRLSGGIDLKQYHPELESVFMIAFRHTITAGGIIAVMGMLIAFLRGPDHK